MKQFTYFIRCQLIQPAYISFHINSHHGIGEPHPVMYHSRELYDITHFDNNILAYHHRDSCQLPNAP